MSKWIKITEKEFKAISELITSDESGQGSYDPDYCNEVTRASKALKAVIKRNFQDKPND